jgi:hypothetical protein
MPEGLGPRFAVEAGFLILLAGVAAYARLSAAEIILVMAGGWLLASVFEVLAARRERLYPRRWERRMEAVEEPVEREPERRRSWFRRPVEETAPAAPEAVAAPETPSAAEVAPVAAEAAPVAAEDAPVAAEAAPVAAEAAPVADEVAPVAAEEQPRIAPEAPLVREPEPLVTEREPVAPEPLRPAEPALPDERLPAPPGTPVDDEATGEITPVAPKRRWFRRTRPEPEEAAPEVVARPSARHVRLIRGTTSEDSAAEERKDREAGS